MRNTLATKRRTAALSSTTAIVNSLSMRFSDIVLAPLLRYAMNNAWGGPTGSSLGIKQMRGYCLPTPEVTGIYPTPASRHFDGTSFRRLGAAPQYLDPEFLHSPLQRRSLNPQTGGGTLGPGDDPV